MSRSDRRPTCFVIAAGAAVILVTVATAGPGADPVPRGARRARHPAGRDVRGGAEQCARQPQGVGQVHDAGRSATDTPASMPGTSFLSDRNAPRPTGLSLPFRGQPVQGFSGIKPAGDGSLLGADGQRLRQQAQQRRRAAGVPPRAPRLARGTVAVERTVFLSDPNRVIPFHIVTDPSPTRFLTGADLDIESIQPVGDGFWFGDEFGPYLIRTDAEGRVTHFRETRMDGRTLRGPDHFALQVPASPAAPVAFEVRRSGGFEGMAASPDGARLYAMLEQPLYRQGTDQPEGRGSCACWSSTRAPPTGPAACCATAWRRAPPPSATSTWWTSAAPWWWSATTARATRASPAPRAAADPTASPTPPASSAST